MRMSCNCKFHPHVKQLIWKYSLNGYPKQNPFITATHPNTIQFHKFGKPVEVTLDSLTEYGLNNLLLGISKISPGNFGISESVL